MKRILFVALFIWLSFPTTTLAAGEGCVFDNFISTFNLNEDSSVDVTEKIDLVCESFSGMHGIYRVLPIVAPRPTNNYQQTKVELISITDESGHSFNYETTINKSDQTISYKIGDADIFLTGPTTYIIKYRVQNAIFYSTELKQDVFNWNVQNFVSDYPVNNASVEVIFPEGLNSDTVSYNLYSGYASSEANPSKLNPLATAVWNENSLLISNTDTLSPQQGITLFATFDAGHFTYYEPSFWEKNKNAIQILFAILVPLIVASYLYKIWKKYGDDPDINGSIAPAFAPPKNLRPLEMGVLRRGVPSVDNAYLTATIIDLAVRGFISLEEKKAVLGKKDWLIKFNTKAKSKMNLLRPFEREFISVILSDSKLKDNDGNQIMGLENDLSKSMQSYVKSANRVAKTAFDTLQKEGLLDAEGKKYQAIFLTAGSVVIFLSFQLMPWLFSFALSAMLTGFILLVFGAIMPRRTEQGSFLFHEVKGFQLYMKTAERYRQKYFEQENIFEKYLPYAICFGLVSQWRKAMQKMYPEQVSGYAPVWYVGRSDFNINSFTKSLGSMSSTVSSNVASAGSGGTSSGGFSGGGGGGGGAGGW